MERTRWLGQVAEGKELKSDLLHLSRRAAIAGIDTISPSRIHVVHSPVEHHAAYSAGTA
jgi:hypothetical protein